MKYYNFIGSDRFDIDDFNNIERFVDTYPNFQSIILKNENELILLLELIGISELNFHHLNNVDFSKVWDLSNSKLPEFNEEQFDSFYKNWIRRSKHDDNMDEYGNLVFLQ